MHQPDYHTVILRRVEVVTAVYQEYKQSGVPKIILSIVFVGVPKIKLLIVFVGIRNGLCCGR